MPYMYNHNHQNPTYYIEEERVWGNERKKEGKAPLLTWDRLMDCLSSSPEGMPLGELCASSAL